MWRVAEEKSGRKTSLQMPQLSRRVLRRLWTRFSVGICCTQFVSLCHLKNALCDLARIRFVIAPQIMLLLVNDAIHKAGPVYSQFQYR